MRKMRPGAPPWQVGRLVRHYKPTLGRPPNDDVRAFIQVRLGHVTRVPIPTVASDGEGLATKARSTNYIL